MPFRTATLVIAFLFGLSHPAQAEAPYAPGTIGYLYEDCRAALESDTAEGFIDSYCFNFGMGYGFGWMGANYIIPGQVKNDPCADDKARLFDSIENRFCPFVLDPPLKVKSDPGMAVLHLFFGWVAYLSETEQQDKLHDPLPETLNEMITPGPFCDHVTAHMNDAFPMPVSKPVKRLLGNPLAIRKAALARSTHSTYEQCLADIAAPDTFRASLCGAQITGYLTGTHSNAWLQDHRIEAENPDCAPAINRVYDSLRAGQYRCHMPNTEPMLLALAYINKHRGHFERLAEDGQAPSARFNTIAADLPQLRLCQSR